jgi:hypothetical protein
MKTKSVTQQRKAIREFSIEDDLKGEFDELLTDAYLDEEAFAMCEEED